MKAIAYTRPDGGVSVVHPAPNARFLRAGPQRVVPAYEAGALRDIATFEAFERDHPEAFAETEDEFLARVIAKDVPTDATNARVLDVSDLPDAAFRNAWSIEKDKVAVDMPKARAIHRDRLRQRRTALLEALDVESLRAIERMFSTHPELAAIVAKKQALRDVTADPAIAAAKTPAELKAVMPAALKHSAQET